MSTGQDLSGPLLRVVGFLAVVSILLLWGIAAALGLAFDSVALRTASDGSFGVGLRLILFAFAAYFSATIATFLGHASRVLFFTVNTTLLVLVLTIFGLGFLGAYVRPSWIGMAALFAICIQGGALAFAEYRERTLSRLSDSAGETLAFQRLREGLESHFAVHSFTYAALPVGAVTGAVAGIALQWTPQEVMRATLTLTLVLIAAGVLVFLTRGALFLMRRHLAEGAHAGALLHVPTGSRVPLALVPALEPGAEPTIAAHVDGIVIASDLRRLFLVNQYQQLVVLIAAASGATALQAGGLDLKVLTAVGLVAGLLFTQLPYVIGQQRAHAHLLNRLRGAKREEVREQLGKLAPLAPRLDSWLALTLSGTLGSVAGKLLERTVMAVLGW